MKKKILFLCLICISAFTYAEDGYRLRLRYDKISNPALLQQYRNSISGIVFPGNGLSLNAAKKELIDKYYAGVYPVRWMQDAWNSVRSLTDPERYQQVKMLLTIQEKEAVWWRNACVPYFQTFSRMPILSTVEKPDHTLEYYKGLRFPYAPCSQ